MGKCYRECKYCGGKMEQEDMEEYSNLTIHVFICENHRCGGELVENHWAGGDIESTWDRVW